MDGHEHGAEHLPALLDEVYTRLRHGEISALGDLARRIEAAEAGLSGLTVAELTRIRDQAERNARMLTAARRGIRAAQRRIAEVVSAARGLVTYDRQGHRVQETDAGLLARRF